MTKKTSIGNESEIGLFLTLGNGTSGAKNENLRPLSIQIYHHRVRNMVSETNFGHFKVIFSPLYMRKSALSQIP